MTESRVNRYKRKRRKWPYWIIGIFLFFLIIGVGALWYFYDKVEDTITAMHHPLDRDSSPDRQKELINIFKEKRSINVLLLGVDEREGDRGRSDTMIVLNLNPQNESMRMVSIPRDTYVNIAGYGMDEINHAYAFGGVDLAVQTVEEAFDLPIHLYSRVNMEGFQQGIDAINGVTIQNNNAFTAGQLNFEEGEIHLNGEEALAYIRMRKDDPRGDIGRNERQRNVITAAMNEVASFSSLTKINEIFSIMGENVQTNIDMESTQQLFTGYLGTRKNIETLEIAGNGQMIGGIWYYIVPDSEFKRIKTALEE